MKLTPATDALYETLGQALSKIKKVADNINEQKRNVDYLSKIVDIQSSIQDLPIVYFYFLFLFFNFFFKEFGGST